MHEPDAEQVLLVQSAADAHETPLPDEQVFVVALQAPVAHTFAAVAQVPSCSPSLGTAWPATSFVTQANVARSQNWLPVHSESLQHAPLVAGTQAPDAAQWLLVHCELPVQLAPGAEEQVFVVALHAPVAQMLADVAHVPSCSPSLGMVVPAVARAVQRYVSRAQYWAPVQSLSAQQCPAPEGTQAPEMEQALLVHSAANVQGAALGCAQVLVAVLHAPLVQTVAAVAQVPSCSPSVGIAAPAASFERQVNVARSQKVAPWHSASDQHAPLVAGTHAPEAEQLLLVHCEAAVQLAPGADEQVFVTLLHASVAQTFADVAQVPSCSPSLGMGPPATTFAVQVNVPCAQYWPPPQSLSA
jgi:hypothetical protein